MKPNLLILFLTLSRIYFVEGGIKCNSVQNQDLTKANGCQDFEVEEEGKKCVSNIYDGKTLCIEKFPTKCNSVTSQELTGKDCSEFDVEKSGTSCKATGNKEKPCQEVNPKKCKEVENHDLTGFQCSDFETEDTTKKCVKNENGSSPCTERNPKCTEVTNHELTKKVCSEYSTSSFVYKCVKNEKEGEQACKEQYSLDKNCTEIEQHYFVDAQNNCTLFRASDSTKKCIAKSDTSGDRPCQEVILNCNEVINAQMKQKNNCSIFYVTQSGYQCSDNNATGGCLEVLPSSAPSAQSFIKFEFSFILLLCLFLF